VVRIAWARGQPADPDRFPVRIGGASRGGASRGGAGARAAGARGREPRGREPRGRGGVGPYPRTSATLSTRTRGVGPYPRTSATLSTRTRWVRPYPRTSATLSTRTRWVSPYHRTSATLSTRTRGVRPYPRTSATLSTRARVRVAAGSSASVPPPQPPTEPFGAPSEMRPDCGATRPHRFVGSRGSTGPRSRESTGARKARVRKRAGARGRESASRRVGESARERGRGGASPRVGESASRRVRESATDVSPLLPSASSKRRFDHTTLTALRSRTASTSRRPADPHGNVPALGRAPGPRGPLPETTLRGPIA